MTRKRNTRKPSKLRSARSTWPRMIGAGPNTLGQYLLSAGKLDEAAVQFERSARPGTGKQGGLL